MVPGGQLGHHPAIRLMHRNLAVETVRQQSQVGVVNRHPPSRRRNFRFQSLAFESYLDVPSALAPRSRRELPARPVRRDAVRPRPPARRGQPMAGPARQRPRSARGSPRLPRPRPAFAFCGHAL